MSVNRKASTMPRQLKSTEGVKIVELHKGPTGLGMILKGGSDENLPITVREVFPGGTAWMNFLPLEQLVAMGMHVQVYIACLVILGN